MRKKKDEPAQVKPAASVIDECPTYESLRERRTELLAEVQRLEILMEALAKISGAAGVVLPTIPDYECIKREASEPADPDCPLCQHFAEPAEA